MGFNVNTLKALSILHQTEPLGGKCVLTLGRQNTCFSLQDLRRYFDGDTLYMPILRKQGCLDQFVDTFLTDLGFSRVESLDYSSFEGADIVHDLNKPVPEVLLDTFDVIIDGGTLEHVFDFPVAISSCMKMVKQNGHMIVVTPSNNLFGHGFYQFSPELFYRIFSEDNGFTIIEMFVNGKKPGTWYRVVDPITVGERVALRNSFETELIVVAKKLRTTPERIYTPQQSDYLSLWKDVPNKTKDGTWIKRTYNKLFSKRVRDQLWNFRNKKSSSNIGYFKKGHFKRLN